MAKAVAHCTCKKCGKEFTRDAIKRNRAEADNWAAWAAENYDECSDCYAARKREEEKAIGLTCDIRLDSAASEEIIFYGVFGGDTLTHKDALKAAGCRWTDYYPSGNAFSDLLMIDSPRRTWVLMDKDPDLLIAKAEALGATIKLPDGDALAMWAALRAEHDRIVSEKQSKTQAALDELGPIPEWPESIKDKWPSGAKWNGTIYGKAGGRNIYLSGERIALTDEEAAEMEKVAAARKDWRAMKRAIEEN